MTPFGARLRQMRRDRDITLSHMAQALKVSPAYLSALEHGRRGRPTFAMVQQIIAFFNIIWDEAEELQRLAAMSDPRVTVDTAGLSPKATRLANRLARDIHRLDEATLDDVDALLDGKAPVNAPRNRSAK